MNGREKPDLMKWFRTVARETGWMALGVQPDAIVAVHGRSGERAKPQVVQWTLREAKDLPADLSRLSKELSLSRFRCTTLLQPGEYQMLVVDAPAVPKAELKGAMRWRLKDMLDYHVDDAMIDVLDIPPDPSGATRAHYMHAVAAPNEVIQKRVRLFEEAHIPLSVIDVPELAQRNIASLYEADGVGEQPRGIALLHFSPQFGLLTINFGGELYFARRIEATSTQLMEPEAGRRQDLFNRILLEVQRSLDHFDRQFRFIAVARFLVGPEPADSGLSEYLGANLGLPVERVALRDRVEFAADAMPGAEDEWRLFHQIGASLRNETAVL
jgi:MSHA biogenesis protein MshI